MGVGELTVLHSDGGKVDTETYSEVLRGILRRVGAVGNRTSSQVDEGCGN